MRAITPLLLLLLVACGGNSEGNTEELWLPSYDTPANTMEAYLRGIETGNLELCLTTTVPSERQAHAQFLNTIFAEAKKRDFRWKTEVVDGTAFEVDKEAVLKMSLKPVDDQGNPKTIKNEEGKTMNDLEVWRVSVKQSDGSWRISPSRSAQFTAERNAATPNRQPENPPANSGG
jgi:hypothetical protein